MFKIMVNIMRFFLSVLTISVLAILFAILVSPVFIIFSIKGSWNSIKKFYKILLK